MLIEAISCGFKQRATYSVWKLINVSEGGPRNSDLKQWQRLGLEESETVLLKWSNRFSTKTFQPKTRIPR